MKRVSCLLWLLAAACHGADKGEAPVADKRAVAAASAPKPPATPSAPLAAVGRPVAPVERGDCWISVSRRPEAQLADVQDAFRQRNPGWQLTTIDVDTARVQLAHIWSNRPARGTRSELSDEAYRKRAHDALERNADLLGLTTEDLNALVWDSAHFVATDSGWQARAHIPCLDPRGLIGSKDCWKIGVGFWADGSVHELQAYASGPPAEICTNAVMSAERAYAAAASRGESPGLGGKFDIAPRLTIARDHRAGTAAPARWVLVWEVKRGFCAYHFDAVTEELIGAYSMIADGPGCRR